MNLFLIFLIQKSIDKELLNINETNWVYFIIIYLSWHLLIDKIINIIIIWKFIIKSNKFLYKKKKYARDRIK
jgi:hypothetical protein